MTEYIGIDNIQMGKIKQAFPRSALMSSNTESEKRKNGRANGTKRRTVGGLSEVVNIRLEIV